MIGFAPATMLIHSVFFWLKPELTAAQRADFRRGVESLAAIQAIEKVYVGAPAATAQRSIIDHSYTVALTVVCRDVAAHDAYQVAPDHLKFIEENKPNWKQVRVFDSKVGPA